jgi:hypothetical protein
MKTILGIMSLCALMLFAIEGHAQVQVSPPPQSAFFTIDAGGFFPTGDLGDGEFDNTETVNATLGVWFGDFVGVRANVLWANPDISGSPPVELEGESPDIFYYTGDLLLRYPMQMGQGSIIPYAIAGLGARTMNFDAASNQTDLAGNAGAGLEYRFGQMQNWGIRTEVRGFGSNLDAFGLDENLWDVAWTGGLTFAF